MKSFKEIASEKEIVSEANEYWRIPEKVIKNDFYVFQKEIAQMYKSLMNGNDLNYNYFMDLKKRFEKIEKSIEHTPKSNK
jgi:hypothetical protein